MDKKDIYNKWKKKKVLKSITIFDGTSLDNVVSAGEDKHNFTTSITDKGLCIKYDPKITHIFPRPTISVTIKFTEADYSMYNRVHAKVYVKGEGLRNLYMHFALQNDDKNNLHAPSLELNTWQDVIYEMNQIERQKLSLISIVPFLGGCPPEANGNIEVYIKSIAFETVEPEYELGYDIGSRLAYSQLGYYCDSKKQFIASGEEEQFAIIQNGTEIYRGNTQTILTTLGKYRLGDFTHITTPGKYKIKYGKTISDSFLISMDPYREGIKQSLYFLYQLRCGEDIPGVHSACHLHSKTTNDKGEVVPNFGGWHDAADLSQFEICTAEIAIALLDLAKYDKMEKRILEEAKVGLNWLLRTTFHDGTRALAISYDRWFDNLITPLDHFPKNTSEDGPFENFISSYALAKGYKAFSKIDKPFASWCLRVAKEDFFYAVEGYQNGKYSKRWGPHIVPQTLGVAIQAATELYDITEDDEYINHSSFYAKEILACQQQTYPKWDIPVRGFFYETSSHLHVMSYEHRGHEELPICGLIALCKRAKDHPDYNKWLEGINLYREYILTTQKYTAPYDFLPSTIYQLDKVNIDRFTIPRNYGTKEEGLINLQEQIKNGVKLNDGVYLRRMPIAIQRRGYHATLLSKAKAVSMMATFFKDEQLKQIAIKQLEWIHGNNPFATSTMYGVGKDYHPLYVAYSNQMIGALPVGFETFKESDKPYWPAICNAVYKEVWGHTTSKYLAILADLEEYYDCH